MEKMTNQKKSARLLDVGRPKIRPVDEDTILSFKVSAALVKALDAEAERMTTEKPAGSARVSRSEAIQDHLEPLARLTSPSPASNPRAKLRARVPPRNEDGAALCNQPAPWSSRPVEKEIPHAQDTTCPRENRNPRRARRRSPPIPRGPRATSPPGARAHGRQLVRLPGTACPLSDVLGVLAASALRE